MGVVVVVVVVVVVRGPQKHFDRYTDKRIFAVYSFHDRGVGDTVASEYALRSEGILLSRVRAPTPGLTEGRKA
ncbi:hypothetical protein PoB_002623300 [Plakobranchus ocellatus]|uniref:Uncharacterized protein n=1 Tax=Plakobranchus ocellatus TaxID=259542 RepID=A0AAV3ZZB0_9GAST|nr:hypothetical protein PoB_002623300 [Plakobranchus ocellatus]